jgi:hypothetical protein
VNVEFDAHTGRDEEGLGLVNAHWNSGVEDWGLEEDMEEDVDVDMEEDR